MFRVLLPDGELTVCPRFRAVKEKENLATNCRFDLSICRPEEANAIYLYSSPYKKDGEGLLLMGLSSDDVQRIFNTLLENCCYDFSQDFSVENLQDASFVLSISDLNFKRLCFENKSM